MSRLYFSFFVLSLFIACNWNEEKPLLAVSAKALTSLKNPADIEPPQGFVRINLAKDSFGEWLRNVPLKKDNQVYLYDGSLKKNQTAQFAVLAVSVGDRDLQQCADAVMRLRAESLFAQKRYHDIEFRDNADKVYKWASRADKSGFEGYLQQVFGMCGLASLERQLTPVADIKDILPGDVLIKGGFPGHAMIVMDVAINDKGNTVFMLAQSYMPAQDIHIVKNPGNNKLSPWYEVNNSKEINTPEWIFSIFQLKKW